MKSVQSIIDPYKGFPPSWTQHVNYCNVVKTFCKTCNSSSSLVCLDQRERIICFSAGNVAFAVPNSMMQSEW